MERRGWDLVFDLAIVSIVAYLRFSGIVAYLHFLAFFLQHLHGRSCMVIALGNINIKHHCGWVWSFAFQRDSPRAHWVCFEYRVL